MLDTRLVTTQNPTSTWKHSAWH